MSIEKLKTKFVTGAFINDVKHFFKKINEIIDVLNGVIGGSIDTRPYKTYVAILNQSEVNDPVATILENTLGEEPTLELYSTGVFKINTHGLLTYSKRLVNISPTSDVDGKNKFISYDDEGLSNDYYAFKQLDDINVLTNGLSNISIEIRIYN